MTFMGRPNNPKYGFPPDAVATIYGVWRHLPAAQVAFSSFGAFLEWCSQADYEYGRRLFRLDTSKPYSPDNCQWRDVEKTVSQEELVRQWDDFITPIRERFAADLEVVAALQELKRQEEIRKTIRECFRYEHPDLEREGIVFDLRRDENPAELAL